MPREKVTIEEVTAAKDCVEGRLSQSEAARRLGVNESAVRGWVKRYKANGELAFQKQEHNAAYSIELKLEAVKKYLSGVDSLEEIAARYGLRSKTQLRCWIKQYNSGKEFGRKMSGGSHMKQGRETTQEERVAIAKDCVENGCNYGETAIKHNVSYQQVYTWVKKFKELGAAGLEDRRGQRVRAQTARTPEDEMRIRIAQLEHKNYMLRMERDLLKKTGRAGEAGCLSQIRQEQLYAAIRDCHAEFGNPIEAACRILHVSRAAYYRWASGRVGNRTRANAQIAKVIEQIHEESPDKGYRRIRDELERYHGMDVNEKRVLRICRAKSIQSTIKHANHGCTRHAPNPQYIAENILNRQFHADKPNEKWLTDVTEFKYYVGMEVHKVYLSAILDLYDRRIVSFVIRDSNDLPLVFDTLDAAVKAYPNAHPLFHSDRGFQYTHRGFHQKLEKYGMKQSMSRVGKCIDNGPMEGFWGILKRERYYARRFTSRDELVGMIEDYITYYNSRRLQRNLGVLTPMEKYAQFLVA